MGSTCGQRWVVAPALKVPNTTGVPPAAGTRMMVVFSPPFGEKKIVSSSAHVPPRPEAASHTFRAAPPVTDTFFSELALKNPIH